MTIAEAFIAARDTSHPGVRRRSWNAGVSLKWDASRLTWMACLWPNGRYLPLGECQGMLTPESIVAMDWEVVP